jgi:hypothetical protein
MFDRTFTPFSTAGRFRDAGLPAGYAPFGIQAIGDRIYVAYAKQDVQAHDAVNGAGLGVVDVYDTADALLRRLVTGGPLDAPWGMAIAPVGFGTFGNALLVGNFGDGRINAFDPVTAITSARSASRTARRSRSRVSGEAARRRAAGAGAGQERRLECRRSASAILLQSQDFVPEPRLHPLFAGVAAHTPHPRSSRVRISAHVRASAHCAIAPCAPECSRAQADRQVANFQGSTSMPYSSRHVVMSIALAALASGAQSAVVYSLADNGTSLVRFDSATPGAVSVVGAISGATGNLNGLDFRPANGLLYGYQQASSGIYRVDASTGATTLVSTSNLPVSGSLLGIDFNPVPDRLRVVTANDENRRINVDNGVNATPGGDTALAYAAGDANAGADPSIVDAAYTFSDRNPVTGTTLYYIDYVLDTLVSTGNPNGGVLNTVGALGVDTDRFVGFDIFTGLDGTNTGFASLTVGGVAGLYTLDLTTGAASPVGAIGARQLFGLAVAPVPEPGSLALVSAAGLAAFGLRRRGPPAEAAPVAAAGGGGAA